MKTNEQVESQAHPVVAAQRPSEVAHAITDGDVVLATIDVPASAARVVRALMTSECEVWWGAPGVYTMQAWHADLRVGGSWSVIIRLPDGTPLPSGGNFIEVTERKIVQTRHYDFDHPTLGRRVTKVTTLLSPIDGGTRVVVRHDDFASPAAALEHAGGWERMLDWLRAYLTKSGAEE